MKVSSSRHLTAEQGADQSARTAAIVLNHVTKRYGSHTPVLEDLSLTIAPGEFVSVVGPSGGGKSTLLRVIAGLSPITSGSILVDGMAPIDAREILSFIFQDATLLPWRTIRANIAVGMELAGATRELQKKRTDSLLSLVGLTEVADDYPRQLSGGMKMRVSIARALSSNPRVLLLDEPFAALDEVTRDRMNEELLRLYREKGWTVIFVTHSVAEAVFLSQRVLVLAPRPGRIAHDLVIDLDDPRSAETRTSEAYHRTVAAVSRSLREAHQP